MKSEKGFEFKVGDAIIYNDRICSIKRVINRDDRRAYVFFNGTIHNRSQVDGRSEIVISANQGQRSY
jgi:hypothetical protein